jgi:hypothetical protein
MSSKPAGYSQAFGGERKAKKPPESGGFSQSSMDRNPRRL